MAQADFFLKIDGIDGESQDTKHKNEIQVDSFSFSVTNTGSGGYGMGSGAGKASVQDMHFTKLVDKSTPIIFSACCSGKHFGQATVTCRKAGENPHEYLIYKLTEVFISSISTSGHEGGGIAQESVSLNFSKVELSYAPQNADGTPGAKVTKGYHLKENQIS
jgi:type VI secretion system secreted protein Hcp